MTIKALQAVTGARTLDAPAIVPTSAGNPRGDDWTVLLALIDGLRGRRQANVTLGELRDRCAGLRAGAIMRTLMRLEAYGLITRHTRVGKLLEWRVVGDDLQRLNESRARRQPSTLTH
jgi:hypothetical protein